MPALLLSSKLVKDSFWKWQRSEFKYQELQEPFASMFTGHLTYGLDQELIQIYTCWLKIVAFASSIYRKGTNTHINLFKSMINWNVTIYFLPFKKKSYQSKCVIPPAKNTVEKIPRRKSLACLTRFHRCFSTQIMTPCTHPFLKKKLRRVISSWQ